MTTATASTEIVTMSLLRYGNLADRWWAFTQMGFGPVLFRNIPGLKLVKMLGSGAGNGFSIRPNLGVYALLQQWETAADAQRYFAENAWWQRVRQRTEEQCTFYLRTAVVHGQWGGQQPFTPTVAYDVQAPVAVITRATIKTRHLLGFWRYVPRVSAHVKDRPGQLLSIGVGEWPLFMQATFSIWTSSQAMMDYAYQQPFHREVVQKTRELGWYKEELFARFLPYASEGTWEGKSFSLPLESAVTK
ncbi:MAG: hypothetical protein AAGJ82_10480 [Bacteroidota bacterium]